MLWSVRITALTALTALCVLSGCGFQPVYGTHDRTGQPMAVQQSLNDIYIGNIPDQEGQFLRNLLIDRFYYGGRPQDARYHLEIDPVRQQTHELGITKSADATRSQLRLTTRMQLHDRESGKVIMSRRLVSITSYNVLESQFTTRVSEQAARESALNDLARQIETHLALHFRR